jgi:heme/copper-type cytochrome/quinol oxidase subunit 2
MSEPDAKIMGKAKQQLVALNWYYVILVLGLVGLLLFLVWYWHQSRKKKDEKQ